MRKRKANSHSRTAQANLRCRAIDSASLTTLLLADGCSPSFIGLSFFPCAPNDQVQCPQLASRVSLNGVSELEVCIERRSVAALDRPSLGIVVTSTGAK